MESAAALSELIVATLILAMGFFALGLAAMRSTTGDRAPVWFGLFGCLYGLRLAVSSELLHPFISETFARGLTAFVTYVIVVPVILFAESILGPGWRSSLRRSWQLAGAAALFALANDLARGRPGATLWLNPPVVLGAGGVLIAHLAFYRKWGSRTREFRLALASGLLFLGVAAYETAGGEVHLEHFAMLLFMTSVGYSVLRGMLATERRFVAISRELEIAREIQRTILPRDVPQAPGLGIAACYLPMAEVGGDFYDFTAAGGNGLGLIVADVSGHGVPAALVASMVKMGFAAEAERLDRPGLVLRNINRMLCGKFSGAFVTACCAFIDGQGLTMRYASAGHPAPLLRRGDGRVEVLAEHGLTLAIDAGAGYESPAVALAEGDRLVFFTDGLSEARNAGDDFFGPARLEGLLAGGTGDAPARFIERVVGELRSWVGPGARFQDDVTMVVVDVAPRGGSGDVAAE